MTSSVPKARGRLAGEERTQAGGPGNDVSIRADLSAHTLRVLARKTASLRASLRMRAVAHILAGASIAEAAAGAHVRTRTLQNWITRYNAEGIAGLADRRASPRDPDDRIGSRPCNGEPS